MPWPINSPKNIRKNAKENGQARYDGKPCKKCGHTERFTCSGNCTNCNTEICRSRRHLNKESFKFTQLKLNYGLTKDKYLELIELQNNRCKICNIKLDGGLKTHVDHCHKTGKIRGILCNHCNLGIGHLKDDPKLLRAAALYYA